MRPASLRLSLLVALFATACSPRAKESSKPAESVPAKASASAAAPVRPATNLKIAPNDLLFGKAPQDKIISAKLATALDTYIAGNLAECERILRAIIAEFPREAPPHVALARFLYVQKKFPETESELLTAAKLKPAAYIYVDLGTLYAEALDRAVEAVDYFNKAALLDPRHAGTHYALGQLYTRLDQPDAALPELAKAAELSPHIAAPFIVRARAYLQLKKPNEALKECDEALRREPGNRIAFEIMADIYNATGEDKAAREYYEKAVYATPPDAGAWTKLGMFHQSRGQWADADAAYAKALDLRADSSLVLNNRAALSLATGADLPRAISWARDAVRLKPGNADFLDTLGELLHRQGEHAAARTQLEAALAVVPDYPSAKFHLAQTLQALGQSPAAADQLRAALASKAAFPERAAAEKLLTQLSSPGVPSAR